MGRLGKYYISRVLVSATLGAVLVIAGLPWWAGVLAGGLTLAWFLLAPRTGRYVVNPRAGAAALQRDERARTINNAAARNAFVFIMLAAAGVVVYAALRQMSSVPVYSVQLLLVLGLIIYYASDFWLSRT